MPVGQPGDAAGSWALRRRIEARRICSDVAALQTTGLVALRSRSDLLDRPRRADARQAISAQRRQEFRNVLPCDGNVDAIAQLGLHLSIEPTLLQPRFTDAVNKALLDVEASGDAARIFAAWFGPQSSEPMTRKFTIRSDY
jgi:hypothetical protein